MNEDDFNGDDMEYGEEDNSYEESFFRSVVEVKNIFTSYDISDILSELSDEMRKNIWEALDEPM